MIKHAISITVDQSGIMVTASRYDTDLGPGIQPPDFDFVKVEDCAVFAQIISQTLFAFTCIPPTAIEGAQIKWKAISYSPSNSSSDAQHEHIHPGSAQ